MPLPMPSPPDSSLIAAIRERQEDALEMLYDRYASVVYGLCLRILRDAEAAQEETIEVFREVWHDADHSDFDGEVALPTIIHRARCRAVAQLAGSPSEDISVDDHPLPQRSDDEPLNGAPPPSQAPHCSQSMPWLSALRFESNQIMKSLSTWQRTAMELTFYEGLSAEQIARRLNTATTMVHSRVHDGLRRLRDRSRRSPKFSPNGAPKHASSPLVSSRDT